MMAVTLQDVYSTFSEFAPQCSAALKRVEAEWASELVPATTAMGTLADALAASLNSLGDEALTRIFAIVEDALVLGDDSTKDAVATGFLEALMSSASGGRVNLREASRYLGKESLKYCREWDRFTGVRTDGIWYKPQ